MNVRRLLTPLVAGVLLAAAPPASAAPGRVVVRVAERAPQQGLDASVATSAVAFPDGGTAMVGLGERSRGVVIVRLDADGRPSRSFGDGGVVRLPLDRFFLPQQLFARPDGRLLLVGDTSVDPRDPHPSTTLAAVGITREGRLDASFGNDGLALLPIYRAGGAGSPAALAADGSLSIAGVDFDRAAVVRLTPAGSLDASFGRAGVVALPVPGVLSIAQTVGFTGSGRLLALARGIDGPQLLALRSDGELDVGYGENGVARISSAVVGASSMLVDPSGRVDVIGANRIARLTPTGRPDAGFGAGGEVRFPGGPTDDVHQVLAEPDGGLLLFSAKRHGRQPDGSSTFRARRFGPTGGSVGEGAPVPIDPLLGGGVASFGTTTRIGTGTDQGSFAPQAAVRRPDGSIVLVGGVTVQHAGERQDFSTALFAAVALTPGLGRDRSFGGRTTGARFSFRVVRQQARRSARSGRILLRVRGSGPGLALLRVRDGRGRVLARQLVPMYGSGAASVRLPLTDTGARVLRSGGRRVLVSYSFVDAVREGTTGSRAARLR